MQRVRLPHPIDLIRKKPLARRFGVSPWTILRWSQKGRFPKPIRLSDQVVAWRLSDVEAWLRTREQTQS